MSYGWAGAVIGVAFVVAIILFGLNFLPYKAARIFFVVVLLGMGLIIALAIGFVIVWPVPGPP